LVGSGQSKSAYMTLRPHPAAMTDTTVSPPIVVTELS
jgi:hypothetical protein